MALVTKAPTDTNVSPTATTTDPYDNPFRSVKNLTPERVDMGVDYSGSGPIYALGPGIITEADQAWTGAVGAPYPGTFITEQLTQGSLSGQYVYYAEDITPSVKVGQKVDANTVIGTFTGGNQLETGFAVGPKSPGTTLAAASGQASTSGDPGANPTAYGEAYNQELQSVGAPAGIISSTPVGSLPNNWPTANASLTSFNPLANLTSFNPLNPASWISTDMWERVGLVIFGALLVLVGVFMLVGKQSIKIAGTAAKIA